MPRSDGSAFTPFAANVMAILIVGFVIPLVMAAGMNSNLSESLHSTGPDPLIHNQNNAYEIVESGNCSMATPLAYQSLGYVIPSASIVGGSNVSSDETVGDYWMYRINQGVGASTCNNGPYEVSIPMDQFINVEDNISGFYFKMMSNTHGSAWLPFNNSVSPICDGNYVFDARLIIEGEAIIEDYRFESDDCTKFDANTSYQTIYLRSLEWVPIITPIDANAIQLKFEEQGCGATCNVTVEIDRITHTTNQSFDAFAGSFYVQSATFEVDGDKAYAGLVLSAWFLSAFTGLATIASTPLWDPFKNHISRLGAYDL